MKKLVLESTQPFQGLPELVAYDEGLFEREGLRVEWVDREAGGIERKTERDVTTPAGVDPFSSHGRLFERGGADMYNACEWGNYCRVQETGVRSRQLGRRAIVAYGALVVPPDSPVYTPQQLAHRTVGLPFYFGTHYLGLRGAAHQHEQARLSPLLHRLPQGTIPRSPPSPSTISARAASWCAIRRRSRSTRCSAPSTG